ncbi:hypothetical protein EZV62_022790 [Acer yangbiense]|uniref:Transcription factor MYB98 n=1 Tax=Acer yangbiense TaxID=1000413 RepID=A0A5C7H1S6_9ROSI|nr:hypothetical protein EZV62_022790 [Acer yangbiense]
MELDTKLRENNQTKQPVVYLSENNYTITKKPYMKNGIPFEVPFSNKQLGNYLQDFHHLDHNHDQFQANGSSSNPIFGVQTPCFEPFDSFLYGGSYSSNFDFYECKPFADHSNYNNGGHGQVMDNFQTTTGGLLIRLVEQFGIRKWSHIAQMLPGRIGKQCRERWHNHLRPDIKKDIWSEEEDKALIEAHVEIGNKWAEIAKRLPGRTENSIKNHWNATKRRQFSKRKCRSKYPRGSLLQDYIKSLNLDSSTSTKCQGAGRPAATSSKCLQAPLPPANLEDLCPSSTDRLVPEFDFNDVPDFNFDDTMFQESCSIDSLIDEIPCAPIVDHDKSLEILEVPPLDDDNVHDEDPVLVIETEVKKELDLVEMISQANYLPESNKFT